MKRQTSSRLFALTFLFLATGCNSLPEPDAVPAEDVVAEYNQERLVKTRQAARTDVEEERTPSRPARSTSDYRLGPGDVLSITVVGQSSLNGTYTVGPDGIFSFPLLGPVEAATHTRRETAASLEVGLDEFFKNRLSVNIAVTHYENNKVFVLGRVEQPGFVKLTGEGTLLQVLAEAGGLPVREFRSFLARCAIIRGRDEIIWIDLIDLLQHGNIALNAPLQNGDVVFIPDSEDTTVFVMGEVESPGAVPIKVRLLLSQALAQAGGPTEDADLRKVYLVRAADEGEVKRPILINFAHIIETGDFSTNFALEGGDILFVARSGIGDIDYHLRKLVPGLQGLALGAALAR